MGRMVYAVMLGDDAEPTVLETAPKQCPECDEPYPNQSPPTVDCEQCGSLGWLAVLDQYPAETLRPDTPSGDTDKGRMVGFWLPLHLGSFQLEHFLDDPERLKLYNQAKEAWDCFVPWAETQGYRFGTAKLWMVWTEVG